MSRPREAGRPPRRSSEERNEEIRAGLPPLRPGERPGAVTVAAGVALALAAGNAVAWLASGGAVAGLLISAILVLAGVGMLRVRYWAVLLFQAMVAVQIIVLFLLLLRAETVLGALVVLALICLLGALFWTLVRPMARIQGSSR